jgi:hypothetical protein
MQKLRFNKAGLLGPFLFALAFAAVAAQAVLPQGYMFARDNAGDGLIVTLCTGNGPARAVLDLETGTVKPVPENGSDHQQDDDTGQPSTLCGFSGAGAPSLAQVVSVDILPSSVPVSSPVLEAPTPYADGAVFPRPPVRGPPVLL